MREPLVSLPLPWDPRLSRAEERERKNKKSYGERGREGGGCERRECVCQKGEREK